VFTLLFSLFSFYFIVLILHTCLITVLMVVISETALYANLLVIVFSFLAANAL